MDRVQTIMPYLSYESDPYMVTVDGKLYWMIDAYTSSSTIRIHSRLMRTAQTI